MKRITLYCTEGHSSVSITNGATRETSGPDFAVIAAAMHPEDRTTLAAFAAALLASLQSAGARIGGQS